MITVSPQWLCGNETDIERVMVESASSDAVKKLKVKIFKAEQGVLGINAK